MRLVFSLILAMFIVLSASAKQKGDSLYVYARSGIKLRLKANPKSEHEIIVPFGAKVKYYYTSRVKIEKGYFDSRWAKIGYDGNYGFISDTYLSKLPLIDFSFVNCDEKNLLTHYIETLYNVKEIPRGTAFIGHFDGEDYHITKDFDCNASKEVISMDEDDFGGSAETKVKIKGVELTEAYFLMKYLLGVCNNRFNKEAIRSLRVFNGPDEKPNRVSQTYNSKDDQFYIIKSLDGSIEIKMTSSVIQ